MLISRASLRAPHIHAHNKFARARQFPTINLANVPDGQSGPAYLSVFSQG